MTPAAPEHNPALVAFKVRYRGWVQGVGFRFTVLDMARRHAGVTGYVMNMPDGDVEMLAEGPAHEVAALLDDIAQGPHKEHIRQAAASQPPPSGSYRSFSIVH
jgi:acylphosphatase